MANRYKRWFLETLGTEVNPIKLTVPASVAHDRGLKLGDVIFEPDVIIKSGQRLGDIYFRITEIELDAT